jgi:hypothetical protein
MLQEPPVFDPSRAVSSYLYQPLDWNHREFLEQHIARLEAERRRLDDQLALLRAELARIVSAG